jgi:hypothetical protein
MAFALAGTTFGAIDKPLLEVNFGNPGWMEFMPGSTNGISVDGDIVRLLPKAFMRTGLLPLKKGDIITASIDACCTGIVPPDGQPGWCIGSATIQLYDASEKNSATDFVLSEGTVIGMTRA